MGCKFRADNNKHSAHSGDPVALDFDLSG